MNPPPEGGWESLKVDELKAELEARGLPKSGKKEELIARLADDDVAQAGTTPGAAPPRRLLRRQWTRRTLPRTTALRTRPPRRPPRSRAAVAAPPRPAPPPARRPSRRPDEAVTVRARARYVRTAPRKARLVMDHIRGKRVEQAQAILQHAPRAVSTDILKLLNSAVANAESAYELGAGRADRFIAPSWTRARRSSASGHGRSAARPRSTSAPAT